MDKKRIEVTITAILIVVFILAWANTFKFLRKKAKTVSAPSSSALSTQAASALITARGITAKASEEVIPEKNLEWGRCPFCGKIYSGQEGGPIDLKLTGIVWDEKKPQALINNLILKEGDSIGHFRVIKIFKDKVQLSSDDGVYFEIRLAR